MTATPYIGKGQRCKTPVRILLTTEDLRTQQTARPDVRFSTRALQWQAHCPACTDQGHWIWLRPIRGTYNAAKVCNAKCMGATGPQCECSCAGTNHGGSHGL